MRVDQVRFTPINGHQRMGAGTSLLCQSVKLMRRSKSHRSTIKPAVPLMGLHVKFPGLYRYKQRT